MLREPQNPSSGGFLGFTRMPNSQWAREALNCVLSYSRDALTRALRALRIYRKWKQMDTGLSQKRHELPLVVSGLMGNPSSSGSEEFVGMRCRRLRISTASGTGLWGGRGRRARQARWQDETLRYSLYQVCWNPCSLVLYRHVYVFEWTLTLNAC